MARAFLLAALGAALGSSAADADQFDLLRREFLAGINAERALADAAVLRPSPTLTGLAQRLADDAARRGNAELAEGSEREVLERAVQAGYSARSLAEIFTSSDGTVADVTAHWRERGDRTWRTLVRRDFRDLGIGAAIVQEVPLYVFLVAISWDDYAAERFAEYHDLTRMRSQMLERVNADRERRSLPPLSPSTVLDRVAQSHADDMLRRSYYGHATPDGRTVRERALAEGYAARFAGENIARGQSTIDEVMDGWMASEEHRANLLSRSFTDVGFGLAVGRNRAGFQILWVQVFGRR